MNRRREQVRTETRRCVVCDEERGCVLYVSWQPAGLLSRRRLDERWTWRCLACGTRTPATQDQRHHTV